MLYNGGRNRANLQLAEAALAQARIREESIRGQVTVDAVRTFFDVLLAEKRWALADQTRQEVVAMSARARGPDATTLNALASRLRRRQADARRGLEAARLAYLSAVGLELYTTVELTGDLTTTPVQESLPKLLARAQEARLEIRGTEYQREMDRLAVNLTESERNPVVVFGAAYELNNSDFPLDRAFWNATLNVNLPIFDGFASRSRIRQSRLLASQNRIARAEVEDRINREVREIYNDVMFWQSEMGERKADLDRLLGVSKTEGNHSAADRALSRTELMEAWDAYWESIHGHRVARAKLERAVGLPLAP
jgi:outer membrane protein TolC